MGENRLNNPRERFDWRWPSGLWLALFSVHQCLPMFTNVCDLPQSQQESHHCPRGLSQFQDLLIEDLVSRFVSDNCWRDLPRPLIRRSREICSHCSDYLGIQMESCLLNMALLWMEGRYSVHCTWYRGGSGWDKEEKTRPGVQFSLQLQDTI